MNRAKYFFQMTGRASVFATRYSHLFEKGTAIGDAMAKLQGQHQEYVRLTVSVHGDDVGLEMSGNARANFQAELLAVMDTIRRLANGIELRGFYLPTSRSVAALVSVGMAWIQSEPLRQKFVEAGCTEYLDVLTGLVAKVSQTIDEKTDRKSSRTEAAEAIKETYRRARATFERLNAMVRLRLRNDKPVLAVWTETTHIERGPSKRTTAESAKSPDKQGPLPGEAAQAAS